MDSAYFIGLSKEDGTERHVMVIQEKIGSKAGDADVLNTFHLSESTEALGTITFNENYTKWDYHGLLNNDDQVEVANAIQRRFNNELYESYWETKGFSFVANINQDDVIVEVTPNETSFRVKINGEIVGNIKKGNNGNTWLSDNKEVTQVLVDIIGQKIKDYYVQ